MDYILRPDSAVAIDGELILSGDDVICAINFCNQALRTLDEQTKQYDINFFELLGMRNLSGMVGECFAKSVERFSDGNLHSNLHQDGYPDLLLTNTKKRLRYYRSLYTKSNGKKYPKDKALFSPFKYGGGRTTSVSIMTSAGVRKMCEGWIAVIDLEPYVETFVI